MQKNVSLIILILFLTFPCIILRCLSCEKLKVVVLFSYYAECYLFTFLSWNSIAAMEESLEEDYYGIENLKSILKRVYKDKEWPQDCIELTDSSKVAKHGIQPHQRLLLSHFCHHFKTVFQEVEKSTTGSTVSSDNRQPISAEETATPPRLPRPLTEIRSCPLSPVRISTHPCRFISICCGRMFHQKRHRFR